MNTANGIYALIKFGDESHMEELINDGIIFLRRLKAYSCIEDPARADIYEGSAMAIQPKNAVFTVNGRRIKDFAGPLSIDGGKNPLVYCMYALSPNHLACEKGQYIDKRCLDFGSTAVLIVDVMAFYEKLKQAVMQAVMQHRFNLRCDLVEYVSWKDYSGAMGPFKKFDDHSHQNEWRAVFTSSITDETFQLKLGSLRDIAKIGKAKELNRGIEFIQ
jgi:hypothetical protein